MPLTPEQRFELQKQQEALRLKNLGKDLTKRFTRPVLTGMASKLLKGKEVEEHISKGLETYSKKTDSEINAKTLRAVKTLEQKIDGIMKHLQTVVEARVSAIPKPKDGRTPTKNEVMAIVAPIMDEIRTDFTNRVKMVEDVLSKPVDDTNSDVPRDLAGLEQLIKKYIPKNMGGGGGPGYFFELFDTPNKSKGLKGAYADYVDKYLKVSSNGKRLEWASVAGGSGSEWIVVSSSRTAAIDAQYSNVASATYTDPTPVEGKGFIVLVRNGTATVGGTGYSTAGTLVYRIFHSGAWANYVYQVSSTFAPASHAHTASQITDFDSEVSNNTDVAAATSHIANTSNPHNVTKSQVGLGNVDNTSDATKNAAPATLQNKTLDNTNTIQVRDTLFTIQDDVDATKRLQFQASGISTGTTVTLTAPNASGTIATLSGIAQTFVNTTTFSGQTVTVGTSASTSTYGLGTGTTASGNTKTINIGTSGASGSTTNITLGSATVGAVTTITANADIIVPDEAYDAVTWNGNNEVPTKNAIRDKIESMTAGSGITRSVTVTSGNVTAGNSAATDYVIFVAGAHTVSLPAATSNTNLYTIKNNHTADITIDTVGTETIDGTASISIAPQESVQIISDGTNYFII